MGLLGKLLRKLGFNGDVPDEWSRWWLTWWVLGTPAVIGSAFVLDFEEWLGVAVLGFLLPELISLLRRDDGLPPLTHFIRHFLPNWFAFPLIYGALGSVSAHWLGFAQPERIGAVMALLGWLTDHFSVTYASPDPGPHMQPESRPTDSEQRLAL